MQVDSKAEYPVGQSDLTRIAETLRGREVQTGPLELPKATFVFGPDDGVRRSAIVTPSFHNPARIDAVHYAIEEGLPWKRIAIEGAWIRAMNADRGTIVFANAQDQSMRMSRGGQVSFKEPVNTGAKK